jgi:hypothetical protein
MEKPWKFCGFHEKRDEILVIPEGTKNVLFSYTKIVYNIVWQLPFTVSGSIHG